MKLDSETEFKADCRFVDVIPTTGNSAWGDTHFSWSKGESRPLRET
jgi:hypothetical protein